MLKKLCGAIVGVVLVFVGFFATPSLFEFANLDYLLTLSRH